MSFLSKKARIGVTCALLGLGLPAMATELGEAQALQVLMFPALSSTPEALAFTAVREIGLSYGMRGGLAYRSRAIADLLEKQSERLDRVFPFQPVLLNPNLLPPVIIEATQTMDHTSDDHMVIADIVYRIHAPARLVSLAPTWREYLIYDAGFDPRDLAGWSPKNEQEAALFRSAVEEGFQLGIEQANAIFEANMARMTRDLKGMIRFKELHARKMITPPVMAKVQKGVTGGGDVMNLNEVEMSLEEKAQLKASPHEWLRLRR
jgi:defect in organelle trafficking protein DotC